MGPADRPHEVDDGHDHESWRHHTGVQRHLTVAIGVDDHGASSVRDREECSQTSAKRRRLEREVVEVKIPGARRPKGSRLCAATDRLMPRKGSCGLGLGLGSSRAIVSNSRMHAPTLLTEDGDIGRLAGSLRMPRLLPRRRVAATPRLWFPRSGTIGNV